MVDKNRYLTFEQFWIFYLNEHQSAKSRYLHYFGTITSHLALPLLLLFQLWNWLPMVLLVGYGPAWIGHFFIEKNRPATFQYPFWSLLGDYKMLYLAVTGLLTQELSKIKR